MSSDGLPHQVGGLARSALCTLLNSALVPPATGAKATEYQRAAAQFLNESVLPQPGQPLPEVLLAQDDADEYSESFEETSNEGTPKPAAPATARNPAPSAAALAAGPLGGAGAGAAAGAAAAAAGQPVGRMGARAGMGLGSPPGNASREATAIRGAAGHGRHRMGAVMGAPQPPQPHARTSPSAGRRDGRHAGGDDLLEASYGGSDVASELDLDLSADSPYRPSPGRSPRRAAHPPPPPAPPPPAPPPRQPPRRFARRPRRRCSGRRRSRRSTPLRTPSTHPRRPERSRPPGSAPS